MLADPGVPAPGRIGEGCLVASAQERYETLSVKTHRMIRTAVEQASFDALLKIDVTTVMTQMDGPEYADRAAIDPVFQAFTARDAECARPTPLWTR